MKTLLPTSTAGSLPKPTWLAQPETLWSPWKLQDDELRAGKQDALRLSLDEQLRAGIDIVSDGEQTRQHFVTTFIEHLSGVDFENRQTVRIRNRYDASVPTVVDAVTRQKPVFVDDAKCDVPFTGMILVKFKNIAGELYQICGLTMKAQLFFVNLSFVEDLICQKQ